jgi:hypothetical protein
MFDIIDRSNIAPLMIEPMVGVPDGSIISSKTPSSFKFIMRLQSEVLAGGASGPLMGGALDIGHHADPFAYKRTASCRAILPPLNRQTLIGAN